MTYILWYLALNAATLLLHKKEFDYVVENKIDEDDSHKSALIFMIVILVLLLLVPIMVYNLIKSVFVKEE